MTPAAIDHHTLAPSDIPPLRQAYDLYEKSIAPSEQKPFDALQAMLARPDYRFVLARDAGSDKPIGLAVVFAATDFALLEYLAVAPARRSGGVGSGLFRHCAAAAPGPLLVEVDALDPPGTDRTFRERRITFYRRLGCRQLAGLTYLLPLPGTPPPMTLFLHAPAPTPSIPLATLRHYLATLYARVYGQSPDDPRLPAMLAALPDPVPLV